MLVWSFTDGFELKPLPLSPYPEACRAGLTQQVVPNPREKASLPQRRLSSGSQPTKDLNCRAGSSLRLPAGFRSASPECANSSK